METIVQDVRYGLRMLRANPAFTTVAVLTLALGIGANTAIFTLINAVMLKMLAVQNVERLVVIGDPAAAHTRSMGTPQTTVFSYPLYREIRDHNAVFQGVLAAGELQRMRAARESGQSISEHVLGVLVTGNYFSVLGVNALRGRTLTEEDDKVAGGHPVAVISYSMWQARLNSDPAVLGSTIRLNDYPFTIIGVAPPGFHGQVVGDVQEVWMPMMMQAEVMRGRKWLADEKVSWLTVMARLKPGITVAQAKANVNVIWKQALAGTYGAKVDADDRRYIERDVIDVIPGARGLSVLRGAFSKPLLLLMAIVGLVLLIACVNVANLLLARATTRQKEIAVRLAMGATPARLLRQLLTESVLLSFLGGAFGLLLAFWGTRILLRVSGLTLENTGLQVQPDARVLGFTALICMVTGLLFGLAPALRSLHLELNSTLKNNAGGNIGGSRRGINWGKLLVASQVALSVLVLFGAGLLVRSLRNLQSVDLGYNRQHLLMAGIDPIVAGYSTPAASQSMMNELRDRLSRLPGVRAVSVSQLGLFSGSEGATAIKADGFTAANDQDRVANFDRVGADYFKMLEVPVILGRDIGPQDTASSPRVVVINESLAALLFRDGNPLGRKIWIDDPEHLDKPMEVVGVVRDVRDRSLNSPVSRRFYTAITQTDEAVGSMIFAIRTAGDPAGLADNVRREIRSFNPAIQVDDLKTLDLLIRSTIKNEIVIARLSSFFGGLALALACIGLYGVMSYTVAGRTREIGVRLALGAQQRHVLKLVMREAMSLVLAGMVAGIPLAMGTTRFINSMLFGLKSTDPLSMAVVIVLLGSVAALASFIPARRATRIDPMVALRYE